MIVIGHIESEKWWGWEEKWKYKEWREVGEGERGERTYSCSLVGGEHGEWFWYFSYLGLVAEEHGVVLFSLWL